MTLLTSNYEPQERIKGSSPSKNTNQDPDYKNLVDEILSKSMTETLSRSPERSMSFDNDREAFRKFLEEAQSEDEDESGIDRSSSLMEVNEDKGQLAVKGQDDESDLESNGSSSFGAHEDFNSLSD